MKCSICNGTLIMDQSGESAVCSVCQMTYSLEAIRKLFQETHTEQNHTVATEMADMAKLNKLLDTYIRTRDWDSAQQTVNELLRIDPENQEILSIQENLQDWKNYEFHPVLDYVTHHRTNNGYRYPSYQGHAENIIMPHGIRSISEEFFIYTKIKTIRFPDTLTAIGNSAFYNCTIKTVECNEKLNYIGKDAFLLCSELTNVVFNYGLRIISEGAFGLTKLKEISIPDSVEKIGDGAFRNTPLEKITISDKLLNSINILSVFEGTPYLLSEHPDLVMHDRRQKKVCQHCGCSFKGMLKKVCSACGKPKDY